MRGFLFNLCILLAGCAEQPVIPPQSCHNPKPVSVSFINDPRMADYCREHGAETVSWGGCTTCLDYGTYRVCEIRMKGQINEVEPAALAHELGHAFGCVHKEG